ncbi:OCIA domain-containing protein 1 [Gryllus bimaculatus]|nr:OCIA domain-containing protein 1 [Gryllus bimaculatus]
MDPNIGTEKNGVTEAAQPQGSYRFNTEELRVLRQCNKESFYQRSLPLSTIMCIGTYYAVKFGYLRNHPRFGPTPKVLIAATIGYFVGKFSYQSKCAEKLMQLPNSPIGEMLRQRKRQLGGSHETFADQSSLSWPELDSSAGASQTLESEQPMGDGFDTYRPLDSPSFEEETMLTVPSQTTSYEELRRKNREEFEHKKPKPYRGSSSDDRLVPSSTPTDRESMGPQRAKNKYGDVWAE